MTSNTSEAEKFHVLKKHKIRGFKGLKMFLYNYQTQVVRIVVSRFSTTETKEYALNNAPTTTLKGLEEDYSKIT